MKSIRTRLIACFGTILVAVCAVLGYAANNSQQMQFMREKWYEVALQEASMLYEAFWTNYTYGSHSSTKYLLMNSLGREGSHLAQAERNGYKPCNC